MQTKHKLTSEDLSDLVCTAMEGGISYWARANSYKNPSKVKVEYKHIDLCLIDDNHGVMIADADRDGAFDPFLLCPSVIEKGLDKLQELYPDRYARVLEGQYDAEDADVLIQLGAFGEIVFG
jgi:hypothetical protein